MKVLLVVIDGMGGHSDGAKAAECLAEGRSGKWNDVWNRFREAPLSYGGIRDLLARVPATGLGLTHEDRMPTRNAECEATFRRDLLSLGSLSAKYEVGPEGPKSISPGKFKDKDTGEELEDPLLVLRLLSIF